ncbi:hypothetical protein P5V15_005257 [Pogonomyrmex californicus]
MNSIYNQQFWRPDISYISNLPRRQQRLIIGQYLFPLVYNIYPNLMPHKLTDILLDINSLSALIAMINDPIYFQTKLDQAVNVLKIYYGIM